MTFSGFRTKLQIVILIFLCLFFICDKTFAVITASPSEVVIDLKGRQEERYSEWNVQLNGITTNKASFDFFSSNSRVADVQGDNIIGLKEGVAYITISMSGSSDIGEITVKVVDSYRDPSILQTTSIKPVKSDIITSIPSITTPRPVTIAPTTQAPTPTPKITPVATATSKPTDVPTSTKTTTIIPDTTQVVTTVAKTTRAPSTTKAPTKVPTKKATKAPTKVPTKVPTPVPTPTPLPVAKDFKGIRVVDIKNNKLSLTATGKITLKCETWYNGNLLSNSNYTYYSSNDKIAKVSKDGTVTAIDEGKAKIFVFAPTYMDIGVDQAKKDINANGVINKRI